MKIIELNTRNCVEEITRIVQKQEECFAWGIPDGYFVIPGLGSPMNEEFIAQNGIIKLQLPNQGGVIIYHPGDIEVGHFSKDVDNNYTMDTLQKLGNYLNTKGIDAGIVGNDLLVDGQYKVAAGSVRILGKLKYSALHIAVNINLELIRNVCLKPMIKIPKGLSEYGITTEEMKEFILNSIL